MTLAAARIKHGLQSTLCLGNLAAKRDWGYAPDYVDAMWRMLQRRTCGDYVVATGEQHSVEEWVECVFRWHGLDWRAHVEIDPRLFRPTEVDALCGDAREATRDLDWRPTVGFAQLANLMAVADDLYVREREARGSVAAIRRER